jgi:hypothetical protein
LRSKFRLNSQIGLPRLLMFVGAGLAVVATLLRLPALAFAVGANTERCFARDWSEMKTGLAFDPGILVQIAICVVAIGAILLAIDWAACRNAKLSDQNAEGT